MRVKDNSGEDLAIHGDGRKYIELIINEKGDSKPSKRRVDDFRRKNQVSRLIASISTMKLKRRRVMSLSLFEELIYQLPRRN
jgi:hypothetical protein